jgi:LacI family transcriptional regulator
LAVTIKQIADATGVSRGTVDRVLHNRPGVKPQIAELVRTAARDMGYVPNRAGKMLAAKKQPLLIGCFLPSVGNPFFEAVIRGMREAETSLCDFGVSLTITEVAGYDPLEHIREIRRLVKANCSALCVSTVDIPEIRACLDEIIAAGIPVVTVNTDVSQTKRLCYIGCDYLQSGRTAAGLLSKMTTEDLNILLVTGSLKMKGHNERIQGFLAALDAKRAPHRVAATLESLDNEGLAYEKVLHELKEHAGINCVYSVAAGVAGVCQAIEELNRKQSLYVISHDDVPTTRKYMQKGIIDFTVCQEPEQQGLRAINALFEHFVSDKQNMPEDWLSNAVIKISENLLDP